MTIADQEFGSHRQRGGGRRGPAHAKTSPRWPDGGTGPFPAQAPPPAYQADPYQAGFHQPEYQQWSSQPEYPSQPEYRSQPEYPSRPEYPLQQEYPGWAGQPAYQDQYPAWTGQSAPQADYLEWTGQQTAYQQPYP